MGRAALLIALVLGAGQWYGECLAQGPPPRLIVDNRTEAPVDVEVWAYNGSFWSWQQVTTLRPRAWVPIYDVHQNKRFRALVRQRGDYQYHSVALYHDQAYGGPQDVWWVQ